MYYPKSRIVEGLYTGGGEYKYKLNNEIYVGYYHKFYDGKVFTGKTNKAFPKQEIIPVIGELNSNVDKLYILNTDTKIALFLDDPDPIVDTDAWDQSEIIKYLKIKNLPTNEDNPRKVPQIHYPQPNEKDYENKTIKRYFAMKTNERDVFVEIDKDTYNKMYEEDEKYMWERYQLFVVIWTIVAETKEQVEEINRNILYLKQREIKRNGLIAYLRGNYSKFFKSISQLRLEAEPPQSKKSTPPNAIPIPPSTSQIKSEKFFNEKRTEEYKERIALDKEIQLKKGQQKANQPLFEDEDIEKRTQQTTQDQPEVQTNTTSTSTSNQQTSRNTGGY